MVIQEGTMVLRKKHESTLKLMFICKKSQIQLLVSPKKQVRKKDFCQRLYISMGSFSQHSTKVTGRLFLNDMSLRLLSHFQHTAEELKVTFCCFSAKEVFSLFWHNMSCGYDPWCFLNNVVAHIIMGWNLFTLIESAVFFENCFPI